MCLGVMLARIARLEHRLDRRSGQGSAARQAGAGRAVDEALERPIVRGIAGPGLLAKTVVYRWQDHLPVYRQESIHARDGLELARSTICGWHQQLADLVERVVEAMLRDAFTQPYLCVDATGILVQAKEQCRKAHFWVMVAPERHVIYRYSHKHDSAAVDQLLAGYKGHLVADAHSVYDHLYKQGDVIEVGCWAHGRRYFHKALGSDPARSEHGLALIRALYRVERPLQTATRKKREDARRQKSRPIVDAFFAWCDEQAAVVLDETPISKAIGYARNQRVALSRFIDDGRLPLDNNISERTFVGRSSAGRTGCFSAATRGHASTRSSSPSWPAASSTASSPGPTSATSSALSRPGLRPASLSSHPPSGRRPSRSRTLSSAWPPTSSAPSRSLITLRPCNADRRHGHHGHSGRIRTTGISWHGANGHQNYIRLA